MISRDQSKEQKHVESSGRRRQSGYDGKGHNLGLRLCHWIRWACGSALYSVPSNLWLAKGKSETKIERKRELETEKISVPYKTQKWKVSDLIVKGLTAAFIHLFAVRGNLAESGEENCW